MDVLYVFATYNLIRKPFLMVKGVKMPGISARRFFKFFVVVILEMFLAELLWKWSSLFFCFCCTIITEMIT